ncbi:MAG: methyltransferase domain-containing protein [Gemmatimonadota bacterium]
MDTLESEYVPPTAGGRQTEPEPARAPSRDALSDPPLSARIEPFDSYWQAPADVEKGYRSFAQYYRHNFLPHLPEDREAGILIVSCGPGYLVNLLAEQGYRNVLGIDSDPAKIEHARQRQLDCQVERAFPFLQGRSDEFDAIVCEQELNHLTIDEMIVFLKRCREALRSGGTLVVYGLNGANPLVGAENLAHNIDHFNTFTEYSLKQVLELAGFQEVRLLPLKLYVFWKNPLNYVGWATTGVFSLAFRVTYALYGKSARIMTKKIAATARKPA